MERFEKQKGGGKKYKKKKKKGRTRCGIKRMKSDKRRKKSRFEVFFSRRNRVWGW